MCLAVAMSRAALISQTFPRPPISKTKVPPGARASRTERKNSVRFSCGFRIQCSAALEKTLVKRPLLNAEESSSSVASRTGRVSY